MTPRPWAWDHLADALAAGLAAAEAELALEQAVHGLDLRRELDLHPALWTGLRAAGYGVTPEQRFPRDRGKRRRSEGARCDIVVTPDARPLAGDVAQLGLFAATDAVDLMDALWLEVKVIAQFHPLGPNRAYAQALQQPVWKDVRKLIADDGIRDAGVVLVVFTADLATADHDLGVWAARARARGLPLSPREQRHLAIGDRLGNRVCTVALFPIQRFSLY